MNQRYLLYILIAVSVVFIFYYSFQTDHQGYIDSINASRHQYKRFLITSEQSPLNEKGDTALITYFPPDPDYRVNADVEKFDKKMTVPLLTNKGKEEEYHRYARLHFRLKGESLSLILYQHVENATEFFLPFTDKTNGKETYGAGRYLQIPDSFNGKPTMELDFNRAFNPYCAYNEDFNCPIPPESNQLSVAVKAGEKYDNNY